jgi:hypothetical protein
MLGGVAEPEAVAFLRGLDAEAFEPAAWTREQVLAADPDLTERIYRGWRGVGFRHPDAGYVCGLFPRHGRVELLFEYGTSLADPDEVLTGAGTQTRVLHVTAADPETADRIRVYVQQAIAERLLR